MFEITLPHEGMDYEMSPSGNPFFFYKYKKKGAGKGDHDLPRYQGYYDYGFTSHTSVRYLVRCEFYDDNFVAVKYCRACDKGKKNRFSFKNSPKSKVQETFLFIANSVLKVLTEIVSKHPDISIVFYGSPSIGEEIECTQRFKIYKVIATTFFPDSKWLHWADEEKSFYSILNREMDVESLQKRVEDILPDYVLR